jgi:hypothetical protein
MSEPIPVWITDGPRTGTKVNYPEITRIVAPDDVVDEQVVGECFDPLCECRTPTRPIPKAQLERLRNLSAALR